MLSGPAFQEPCAEQRQIPLVCYLNGYLLLGPSRSTKPRVFVGTAIVSNLVENWEVGSVDDKGLGERLPTLFGFNLDAQLRRYENKNGHCLDFASSSCGVSS